MCPVAGDPSVTSILTGDPDFNTLNSKAQKLPSDRHLSTRCAAPSSSSETIDNECESSIVPKPWKPRKANVAQALGAYVASFRPLTTCWLAYHQWLPTSMLDDVVVAGFLSLVWCGPISPVQGSSLSCVPRYSQIHFAGVYHYLYLQYSSSSLNSLVLSSVCWRSERAAIRYYTPS